MLCVRRGRWRHVLFCSYVQRGRHVVVCRSSAGPLPNERGLRSIRLCGFFRARLLCLPRWFLLLSQPYSRSSMLCVRRGRWRHVVFCWYVQRVRWRHIVVCGYSAGPQLLQLFSEAPR